MSDQTSVIPSVDDATATMGTSKPSLEVVLTFFYALLGKELACREPLPKEVCLMVGIYNHSWIITADTMFGVPSIDSHVPPMMQHIHPNSEILDHFRLAGCTVEWRKQKASRSLSYFGYEFQSISRQVYKKALQTLQTKLQCVIDQLS